MWKSYPCTISQQEQDDNKSYAETLKAIKSVGGTEEMLMKHKKEEVKNKDLMKSIKDAHKHEEKKHKPKEEKKHVKKGGKVNKVMHEFEEGKLHSGSKKGPKVTNPKQAIAIGLSEARKKGEKVSPKKKK